MFNSALVTNFAGQQRFVYLSTYLYVVQHLVWYSIKAMFLLQRIISILYLSTIYFSACCGCTRTISLQSLILIDVISLLVLHLCLASAALCLGTVTVHILLLSKAKCAAYWLLHRLIVHSLVATAICHFSCYIRLIYSIITFMYFHIDLQIACL